MDSSNVDKKEKKEGGGGLGKYLASFMLVILAAAMVMTGIPICICTVMSWIAMIDDGSAVCISFWILRWNWLSEKHPNYETDFSGIRSLLSERSKHSFVVEAKKEELIHIAMSRPWLKQLAISFPQLSYCRHGPYAHIHCQCEHVTLNAIHTFLS